MLSKRLILVPISILLIGIFLIAFTKFLSKSAAPYYSTNVPVCETISASDRDVFSSTSTRFDFNLDANEAQRYALTETLGRARTLLLQRPIIRMTHLPQVLHDSAIIRVQTTEAADLALNRLVRELGGYIEVEKRAANEIEVSLSEAYKTQLDDIVDLNATQALCGKIEDFGVPTRLFHTARHEFGFVVADLPKFRRVFHPFFPAQVSVFEVLDKLDTPVPDRFVSNYPEYSYIRSPADGEWLRIDAWPVLESHDVAYIEEQRPKSGRPEFLIKLIFPIESSTFERLKAGKHPFVLSIHSEAAGPFINVQAIDRFTVRITTSDLDAVLYEIRDHLLPVDPLAKIVFVEPDSKSEHDSVAESPK